jgi:hypothetical protein
MSRLTRVFVGLGVLFVAIVVYLMFFGVQTYFVWQAHRDARKEPMYWAKPIELSDLSVSKASPKKISYFGYEFEVPWGDIDAEKTRVAANGVAVVAFRSGTFITFWTSPPFGLISTMADDGKVDRKTLGQMFGSDAVQSDYGFQRAALEMTPDQFSIFSSRKQVLQQWLLFSLKEGWLQGGSESGLFSVSTEEFKGFQYGNPRKSPEHLSVELFGKDVHLDILFGKKLNGTSTISQADINLVVQSIHKLPAQGMNPSASSQK